MARYNEECATEGCDSLVGPKGAKGHCSRHYQWLVKATLVSAGATCSLDGCDKLPDTRGWCAMHYYRWRRHGDPNIVHERAQSCSVEGCERAPAARSLCKMHYQRLARTGTTDDPQRVSKSECPTCHCGKPSFSRGLCAGHYRYYRLENGAREREAAMRARWRARDEGDRTAVDDLSKLSLMAAGETSCHVCGEECDPEDYADIIDVLGRKNRICGPKYPSIDHIVPLSRGGTHARGNVAIACMDCNRRKADRVLFSRAS